MSNKGIAWVIDGALSDEFMSFVDEFRLSLPLDDKRPTVKRRFFSSAQSCPSIREGLTKGIESALLQYGGSSSESGRITTQSAGSTPLPKSISAYENDEKDDEATSTNSSLDTQLNGLQVDEKIYTASPCFVKEASILRVHILAYMRFLEYDTVGGRLDPHTDGNKVCEDTQLQSTHTMLLYLRDCKRGGETVLLEPAATTGNLKQAGSKSKINTTKLDTAGSQQRDPRIVEAVQPQYGRILLFPHPILHEGAPVVDVPKLCLRAEVTLY